MATMLEVAKRAGYRRRPCRGCCRATAMSAVRPKTGCLRRWRRAATDRICWRATATKTTQTLGTVVTNTLYHGVYFSELLYQVARMTEDKGRQLILADGKHSAQEEREAIQYLLDLRCDAIIIYPRFLTVDEMDEIVENHSQPIMVLNRRLRRHASHCVWSDQKRRRCGWWSG